jgi:hypothetical protein
MSLKFILLSAVKAKARNSPHAATNLKLAQHPARREKSSSRGRVQRYFSRAKSRENRAPRVAILFNVGGAGPEDYGTIAWEGDQDCQFANCLGREQLEGLSERAN